MEQKQFSVSYEPSAYNVKTAIYAVNPNASYARVEGIQVANNDSSDFTVDLFWVDESGKTVTNTIYTGSGKIRQEYYDYSGSALNLIIKDGVVPIGSALNVLSMNLYLDTKDFIFIRPSSSGSDNAFKPTISVTEYFEDGTFISTSVDLSNVNEQLTEGIY